LSSAYTYVGKVAKGFSGVTVERLAAGRTLLEGYGLFFIGTGLLGIPALVLCLVLARAARQLARAPSRGRSGHFPVARLQDR
jgi:PAT family beta-lactamase induction signal transducer AmpG